MPPEPQPQRSEFEQAAKLIVDAMPEREQSPATDDKQWTPILGGNIMTAEVKRLTYEINAALTKAHQDGWYEGRHYEAKYGARTDRD